MPSEAPQTVSYKCCYCNAPMTSVLDGCQAVDLCPACHGSVAIPVPATPARAESRRLTPDEINAAESGEWPLASFERRAAVEIRPAAKAAGAVTGLLFADPDKVELADILNEHAQLVQRVEAAHEVKAPVEPATTAREVEGASDSAQPAKAEVTQSAEIKLPAFLDQHLGAARGDLPAGVQREREIRPLSAFNRDKFKRKLEPQTIMPVEIHAEKLPLAEAPLAAAEPIVATLVLAEPVIGQAGLSAEIQSAAPSAPVLAESPVQAQAAEPQIQAQPAQPAQPTQPDELPPVHHVVLDPNFASPSRKQHFSAEKPADALHSAAEFPPPEVPAIAANSVASAIAPEVAAKVEAKIEANIDDKVEHKIEFAAALAGAARLLTETPENLQTHVAEAPVSSAMQTVESSALAQAADGVMREQGDPGAPKAELLPAIIMPLAAGEPSTESAVAKTSFRSGEPQTLFANVTPPTEKLRAITDSQVAASAFNASSGQAATSNMHNVQFKEREARPGGRFWLIAASFLIAACAGYFIVKTVINGRKQAAYEASVAENLRKAGEALQLRKDIAEAAGYAREAKQTLANPEVPLTPEKTAVWEQLIKSVEGLEAQSRKLDVDFAAAVATPDALKRALKEQRMAHEKEQGPENAALLAKIDKQLEDVEKLRVGKKSAALEKELTAAEDLYKEAKLKEASEKSRQVLNEMPLEPALSDAKIAARAELLIGRNARLETARKIRVGVPSSGAPKEVAEARRRLQAELDQLDPKKEELKPLIASIGALKTEIDAVESAAIKAREEKERQDKLEAAKTARKLKPQDVEMLTKVLELLRNMDGKYEVGKADVDAIAFKYEKRDYRFGIERPKGLLTLLGAKDDVKNSKLYVKCGENAILVDIRHFLPAEKGAPPTRPLRAMVHAMALGEALKTAGVKADEFWDTKEEAPLASGRRFDGKGNEDIFLGNRLYTGKAVEKLDRQKKVDQDFKHRAETLAVAVEKDSGSTREVRDIVAMAVRASATEAEWYDHLPGEFVRHVIDGGYIEDNIPGSAERLKKELAGFRAGFKIVSQPFLNFQGVNPAGEAAEFRTYEDHALWRIYDKQSDTTTFAIKNPDDEKDCLFVLYDYKGKLDDLPDGQEAARVRMTHQAVGVTAEYVPATGKMTWDPKAWELAAQLESPQLPDEYRKEKGYGLPAWSLPPHVLLLDKSAQTKGIVTPYGRLDLKDFNKIKDLDRRHKEMEVYLDQIVKVMPHKPEGSYLHLYYRYFFEYILDSPVTDHPYLMGSRTHCGDIHQTTYQSLERLMGGRFVGDCDDLAEFFMTITRKMGKLSFVMSLPAHAACGWVEKEPNESEYSFYILDTGPPRRFKNRNLDKAVESANRAYDQEGTMRFDPKSLGFLFRFNGEPTRTPYYLSSRMYIDQPYGDAMEKVQSYWHFHFYALGIQTMLEMIEKKGDRVAENCNEVAGLYGQVREVEKSIYWSRESIKQMKSEEKLSRMGEEFRIASMWRGERDNEKAYAAIKPIVDELNTLHSSEDSFNYLGMRMQVAGLLVTLNRPFEAWESIRPDVEIIGGFNAEKGRWERPQNLKLEHMGHLTSAYLKMQDLIRNRKVLTSAEVKQKQSLKKILDVFYSNGKALFEDEDDFNEYMHKYAFIGLYYAAKGDDGRKKYLEQLLKDGPYPEPGKKRNHANRVNAMEEDWKWIRLSLSSYSIAIADAIDLEEPPEKWRVDEAVKLCDQMAKAGQVAAKFGSLGNEEFALMSTRVFRAFLVKDWKDLEEVAKETAHRDWARLTTDVAETFGRGARFCTPEEFATQYRMFTKYVKSKPAYFTVVYEAYRADGFKHALEGAKIACELNPADEDMKRELGYLGGLVAERLKLAEQKKDKRPAE